MVILAVLYVVALLSALAALIAKGRTPALAPVWLLALVLGGVPFMLAAFGLAHPDSPWARHFYGPAKLSRARQRSVSADLSGERDRELRDVWDGEDLAGQDRITRRALRKARRA